MKGSKVSNRNPTGKFRRRARLFVKLGGRGGAMLLARRRIGGGVEKENAINPPRGF